MLRHGREIHGRYEKGQPIRQYRCPVASCPRHNRPFPRLANMREHCQRKHSDIVESIDKQSADLEAQPYSIEASEALGNSQSLERSHSLSLSATESMEVDSSKDADTRSIQSVLQKLIGQRERLDDEIRTLVKAIGVVGKGKC